MAFAAKYLSREYVSKQIATLAKGLESVSTNLSVVALIGLALVPLVPDRVASTLAAHPAPPPPPAAAASAPVEVVKAKPVFVPPAPLRLEAALRTPGPLPLPPAATEQTAPAEPELQASVRVLAKVARERRRRGAARRLEPESGEAGKDGMRSEAGALGKAGTKSAAAAKTPVPPSNPKTDAAKTDTAKAEPPEPQEWSETEIIAALRDCLKRLAPLGAEVEIAAPMKQEQCGNPAPVLLKRIGQGSNRVEFQPPPTLNCAMVAGLHTWVEKTLQPTAQETLGTSITRVRGASGYACRNRNGSRHSDRLSEHAHANAIDIMGFVTADGRTIDVLDRWGPTVRDLREEQEKLAEARAAAQRTAKEAAELARETARQAEKEAAEAARAAAKAPSAKRAEAKADAARKKEAAQEKRKAAEEKEADVRRLQPIRAAELSKAEYSKLGRGIDAPTPTTAAGARLSAEATFLRRLHKGACSAFGTVLGPEANEAHRNHFHFDLAPRRRSNYCE
jgi:hypothetical protein